MAKLYPLSAIQKLIDSAEDFGYEMVPFRPASLGYGSFVLVPPPCPEPGKCYMHIIVEEVYLNEWSSGHKVRQCRKLSAEIRRLIKKYEEASR